MREQLVPCNVGILEESGHVWLYFGDTPVCSIKVGPTTVALQKELARINGDRCPCNHGQRFDNNIGRWEIAK